MVGQTIAQFKIQERLGEGGMGIVYKAYDTRLDRTVALKFLSSHFKKDNDASLRFIHEARAASGLDHPNICAFYEMAETEDGQPFIAMAYYEGQTLKRIIAEGAVPVEEALGYGIQIAQGLQKAHAAGIVHRDVKPANVMVTGDGVVKLLDFGLAKRPDLDLTATGTALGTVAYMSPEQASGGEVDRRTDLWSLGVVLYELLTGRRPFEADYQQALIYLILNEEAASVTAIRPEVPDAVGQVVAKLLCKNVAERYQDAGEVLTDLHALEAGSEPEIRFRKRASIAVLPFENMSNDPSQEYFCDGLAEELITALTKLNNLHVASRTSSFAFKDQRVDIRQVGRKLGVDSVVEGSVRKAGNRLRITTQLVSVSDGYHLWSERFDREMEDIFAIQDEISLTVVEKLKVDLLETEKAALVKRYTENVDAYGLYLKGRYHWNQRTEPALRRAVSYFEQAIDLDSRYALAHVGIADYYIIRGIYGFISATEANAKIETAITNALAIDNALAEGHSSLGFWNMLFKWDEAAAEEALRKALNLNPQDTQARYWYGIVLTLTSRFEEAIVEFNQARALDPLSVSINTFLGMAYMYAGGYDLAEEIFAKVLGMDPHYFPAHFMLGATYASAGRFEEAFSSLKTAAALTQEAPLVLGYTGCVYGMAGQPAEAREVMERLHQLSKQRYVSPLCTAMVHTGLGEKDQAIAAFEDARKEGDPFMAHMRIIALVDSLRPDPRFQAVLDRMRGER